MPRFTTSTPKAESTQLPHPGLAPEGERVTTVIFNICQVILRSGALHSLQPTEMYHAGHTPRTLWRARQTQSRSHAADRASGCKSHRCLAAFPSLSPDCEGDHRDGACHMVGLQTMPPKGVNKRVDGRMDGREEGREGRGESYSQRGRPRAGSKLRHALGQFPNQIISLEVVLFTILTCTP